MPSPSKAKPELVAIDVELGEKPARASVDLWQGTPYISVRMMYEDRTTHELLYSKNGLNVPLVVAEDAINAFIQVLNVSTGAHYRLVEEDTSGSDTSKDI